MRDVLSKMGFGEEIRNWINLLYTDIRSAVQINGWESDSFPVRSGVRQGCPLSPVLFVCCIEPFAESIRKDASIRGVTLPGSGGIQVKTSLYMDDVAVFCSDPGSVRRLISICDQFESATGARVNRRKSEAMLFGNWPDRSSVPFTIKPDFLKVLGIWFGGAEACNKNWLERIARVGKKLELWRQRSLSITGKNLVIRCEVLSGLLYLAQVWPVPPSYATGITRAVFQFIWGSRMDRVRRATMYKSADNGGKSVPNVALILMATFVCGCIRRSVEPRHVGTKCHYLLRFYLSPVLRRMGLAQMPRNVPVSWSLPPHLSSVERFFRTNTFDHMSIGQWSAQNVLQALQGKDSMDPVAWFPEQTAQLVWQNASSPELTNKHQDLAWLAVRGALPVRSFLHRRNLTTSARCPRDGCYGVETVAHLFAECGFAQRVWRKMQGSLVRFIPNSSVTEDSVIYGLFPGTHSETDIKCCWKVINSVKDALWSARALFTTQQSEMSVGECCRLAHCRLQEYVLRDALKLGAANAKARWGRATV